MKLYKWLIAALLLSAPLASQAFTPESGLYFIKTTDATGSGTGLAVEIQNEFLFAVGFVFTPSGSPTYVTIQGQLIEAADGTWNLTDSVGLFNYSGGQCIGTKANCPYKGPTNKSIGGFTIKFVAENIGELTWGASGNTATVIMTRVAISGSDAPGSLVGEWDAVYYNGSNSTTPFRFFGDKFNIQSSKSGAIVGCLATGEKTSGCGSGNILIPLFGSYTTQTSLLGPFSTYQIVVFDNSLTNYQRVYNFTDNGFGGQFTGTIKGTVNICGAGVTSVANCTAVTNIPFVAYRSASARYVQTGNGMD